MKPVDWMKSAGHNYLSIAEKLDCQASTIWRPMTGKSEPTLSMILAFEKLSGGKIGLRDWEKLYPYRGLRKRAHLRKAKRNGKGRR